MARTVVAGKAAGTNNSTIIVTAPTGSLVYIINQDSKWKYVEEKNGVWTFKGCDIGTWTIHASLGDNSASSVLKITEEDQRMRYYVTISYQMYASDFDWSQFGSQGVDYEIVYDDDTPIPQELWATEKNWKARLLTSNTLIALRSGEIDVFMVGGGGNGGVGHNGSYAGNGGGGGRTKTVRGIALTADTSYPIVVGGSAGDTTAFGQTANKGDNGDNYGDGGDGGSGGGGAGGQAGGKGGVGGTDGGNGARGTGTDPGDGGKGQGTTTREFGDPDGRLYAGGGSGGGVGGNPGTDGGGGAGGSNNSNPGGNGADNTGGGGGGGAAGNTTSAFAGGKGGSGIVVIRNAREVA